MVHPWVPEKGKELGPSKARLKVLRARDSVLGRASHWERARAGKKDLPRALVWWVHGWESRWAPETELLREHVRALTMAARSAPAKDGLWKGMAMVLLWVRSKDGPSKGKAKVHRWALMWWAPLSKGKARALPWGEHWEFAKEKAWGPSWEQWRDQTKVPMKGKAWDLSLVLLLEQRLANAWGGCWAQ